MEAMITSFFSALVSQGILSEIGIEIMSLLALALGYKYYLKPMKLKIDSMASNKELNTLINSLQLIDAGHIASMNDTLNKLIEYVDGIDNIEHSNEKELKEIKNSIDQIKQMLNQFQGHMMYSSRSSDFGNKELK